MREDRIRSALDRCYDAVIAPNLWADALQDLARAFDAAAMMFYPYQRNLAAADPRDPNKSFTKVPISHEYQELIDEYEKNRWYLNHYRAERGLPLMVSGQSVVLEHELATDDERRTSRHYNDLYLRFGFPGYAMINVPMLDQSWCIPMLRATEQAHFNPEEARYISRFAPQFRRLINLSEKLEIEKGCAVVMGLGSLRTPAALIDWRGKVLSLNVAAEDLLGPDLALVRGVFAATDPASHQGLQAMIRNALREDRTSVGHMYPSSLVARREGRPILAEILPLSGTYLDLFDRAHLLLLFTDLNRFRAPREERLRTTFGLTASEARLAAKIGAGTELRTAADELGITYETARVQLRIVFHKTDTHRQGELIALLSRLAR
ncbi:helix-turn-helix transcriptional regulator [Ancylobacter amanitiformis]|uniref:DNA-binding CsgD family transcriptional regulator n=1 Tax=Ancylobacter amanitiformis TaxID=217069 RepID=A0ABU0LX05_9HYPH|nr:helix-turn-helix transcriptional regulator [Ancylobacter amanitiformis]MDQ0513200.1 DNA-binding CsgD family transcriptional regulator [Ancylobacter amanitiformis]